MSNFDAVVDISEIPGTEIDAEAEANIFLESIQRSNGTFAHSSAYNSEEEEIIFNHI